MSEATTSFSASGEDAITRVIDVKSNAAADKLDTDFDSIYEIHRTAEEIIKGNYRRIALQFPDELLHDSVPIYRRLKSELGTGTGRELYVLADTSYGSCCVDEVASQHVDADAMVHYGHACMTRSSRLPIIYVYGKKRIDVDVCVQLLADLINLDVESNRHKCGDVLLRLDVGIDRILDKLKAALEPSKNHINYNPMPTIFHPTSTFSIDSKLNSDAFDSPSKYDTIIYVGEESLALTNILMTNALAEVYTYNPTTNSAQLESGRTNKLLMRRYAAVQKARDADVFGILVATLGVASYLPIIRYIRSLLNKHRKKVYTITVGKLNPAKLANFLEIECFVLVACPENSLIDAKDFLRPIITPYELEIAVRAEKIWTGKYILDFDEILNAQPSVHQRDESKDEEDPEQPEFSLVTGKYRHPKRYGAEGDDALDASSSSIILRNQENSLSKIIDSASAQFLQSRTYKGLDLRLGQDAPSVLEQGRSGIAKGYQDDHKI